MKAKFWKGSYRKAGQSIHTPCYGLFVSIGHHVFDFIIYRGGGKPTGLYYYNLRKL